jgi:hypothetical protein
MTHIVAYSLRNPEDRDEIYGDDIAEEHDAFRRAQQLADFYRLPVQVCRMKMGQLEACGDVVRPGPLAPAPLVEDAPPNKPAAP